MYDRCRGDRAALIADRIKKKIKARLKRSAVNYSDRSGVRANLNINGGRRSCLFCVRHRTRRARARYLSVNGHFAMRSVVALRYLVRKIARSRTVTSHTTQNIRMEKMNGKEKKKKKTNTQAPRSRRANLNVNSTNLSLPELKHTNHAA